MPICFTQPICHGGDCLHMATAPPRRWTPLPRGLSLGSFNIRDIQGFRLAQSIQVVYIGGFDLMILTETKIIDQAYFRNRMGYSMV